MQLPADATGIPTCYRRPVRLPAQAMRGGIEDPCLELEDIIDRLARLALHASALAERRPPGRPGGDDRGGRLLAGADLARRALSAAVVLGVPLPH